MGKRKIVAQPEEQEPSSNGILSMLIGIHTFPIDSEEELMERKKIVQDLIKNQTTTTNQNPSKPY